MYYLSCYAIYSLYEFMLASISRCKIYGFSRSYGIRNNGSTLELSLPLLNCCHHHLQEAATYLMDIMWPISQSHFHVSCLCSLK